MEVVWFIVLCSVPAIGLLVLWLSLDRWGKRNDPMSRTRWRHLSLRNSEYDSDDER